MLRNLLEDDDDANGLRGRLPSAGDALHVRRVSGARTRRKRKTSSTDRELISALVFGVLRRELQGLDPAVDFWIATEGNQLSHSEFGTRMMSRLSGTVATNVFGLRATDVQGEGGRAPVQSTLEAFLMIKDLEHQRSLPPRVPRDASSGAREHAQLHHQDAGPSPDRDREG